MENAEPPTITLYQCLRDAHHRGISIQDASEYLSILVDLGYMQDPFATYTPSVPSSTASIIEAAENVVGAGNYSRQEAVSFALHTIAYNEPTTRISGTKHIASTNFFDFLWTHYERQFLALFCLLLLVGVSIGTVLLFTPRQGFLVVDSLSASVVRFYPGVR